MYPATHLPRKRHFAARSLHKCSSHLLSRMQTNAAYMAVKAWRRTFFQLFGSSEEKSPQNFFHCLPQQCPLCAEACPRCCIEVSLTAMVARAAPKQGREARLR